MVQHAVWADNRQCRIRLTVYIVYTSTQCLKQQGIFCCRYWFSTYQTTNSVGLIATADNDANNILNAIFSTGAAVALIVTLFLDNTIPGTKYAAPRRPTPSPLFCPSWAQGCDMTTCGCTPSQVRVLFQRKWYCTIAPCI